MIVLLALTRLAAADAVTDAITDIRSHSSSRVRVGAGIQLVRSGDARAIEVLADVLVNDQDASLRRVAAVGLRRLVTSASSSSDLERALGALGHARYQDANRGVRHAASSSYDALQRLAPSTGTYVEVGPVNVPKGYGGIANDVDRSVERVLAKQHGIQTTTPGPGVHLDIASSFSASQSSGASVLYCTARVLIASYPKTATLITLTGMGSLPVPPHQGASASYDDASDCLDAVVEDLLTAYVVPYIKQHAAAQPATSTTSTVSRSATTLEDTSAQ